MLLFPQPLSAGRREGLPASHLGQCIPLPCKLAPATRLDGLHHWGDLGAAPAGRTGGMGRGGGIGREMGGGMEWWQEGQEEGWEEEREEG